MSGKIKINRWIHALIAVIIGAVICFITPPEGLTPEAMRFAGVFVGVLYLLLTNAFTDFIVGLMGLMIIIIIKGCTFAQGVASFSNSTFLLIVAAMGLGGAVIKTGLLKRVSLHILKVFPKNYGGQIAAMFATGLVVGPFIPALASKSALAGPLALSVSDAFGFPRRGKGASGLFAAAYMSFCVFGLMFLSGTAYSLLTLGMMTPEVAAEMTWIKWFLYSLPWAVTVIILTFFFIRIVYKPEPIDSLHNPNFIPEQLKELGSMSKSEKVSGIILICCMLLWMTASWHGISATVVAWVGFLCMFLFGVLEPAEIKTRVPWNMLLFICSIIGYSNLIGSSGWSDWIGVRLGGIMEPLIGNVYVYVIVLSIVVLLSRYVIISQTATFTLFFVVMAPLASTFGIHPYITGLVISAGCLVWNTNYQNSTWLAAYAAAGGDEFVTFSSQLKMSLGYSAMCIIAALISIPFWKLMGLC